VAVLRLRVERDPQAQLDLPAVHADLFDDQA
jgi:hypothetical protein